MISPSRGQLEGEVYVWSGLSRRYRYPGSEVFFSGVIVELRCVPFRFGPYSVVSGREACYGEGTVGSGASTFATAATVVAVGPYVGIAYRCYPVGFIDRA